MFRTHNVVIAAHIQNYKYKIYITYFIRRIQGSDLQLIDINYIVFSSTKNKGLNLYCPVAQVRVMLGYQL